MTSKTDIFMIHLPNDSKELEKIIRQFSKELESIKSPIFETFFNRYVTYRGNKHKQTILDKRIQRVDVYEVPSPSKVRASVKNWAKFEAECPQYRPILRAIADCASSFKGAEFSYPQLRKELAVRHGIVKSSGKGLKVLAYAFLKECGYSMRMRKCRKAQKMIAYFSLYKFDGAMGLV